MKEFFKRSRWKIAYWLASDWIDDLEYRLSGLLCEVTGNRLSKSYYTLDAMISAINDYNEERDDEIKMDAVCDFAELLKARYKDFCVSEGDMAHTVDEIVAEMEG